ncbi:PPE domain-containing protein [Streptomyces amakusaensis]|uniref:AG2 protein n=1 Tax=Streptomyces amakusaensis TaxID=67271 RepID=A0ABW0AMX0_9ACTN
MDLEALRFANFALLDEAITDWTTTVTHLEALEREAREGLRGRAEKANWSGVNATVSREFIGRTAAEFADARTQATSLRNILKDTRDELKNWHRRLDEAIERGTAKNLTVVPGGGGGFTVTMNIHPDRAAKGTSLPDHSPDDVTALRDEIQSILDKATEIDTSAAQVLKALADQTDHGFSGAQYADRDAGANALKEAEKLSALARRKPDDLSAEDFAALNAGLKKYSGDELFAEHFASQLGAKGTLDFWANLTDPRYAYEVRAHRDQLGELQKNLSLTLANATQSDTRSMSEWKHDMTQLGGQTVSRTNSALGFQVMSNLMRWGNYDDQFLKSYGRELIKTDKELTHNGKHSPPLWNDIPLNPQLNRDGTDLGSDPFTGFLAALSNSPDAATAFFGDTYVSKDEDHDFTEKDGDKTVKADLTNFEYLFEERDWPHAEDPKGKDSHSGRDNLARALEAATTGHPAGELPTRDTPPHNAEQARLMEQLVQSIAEDGERLTKHSYMSDSIGQITAEYLPDISRAAANDTHGKTNQLFPIAGVPADLSHNEVTRLLITLGQSPEGYAAVELGQMSYMANLMDYHLNPNLPENQRYSDSPENIVEAIARNSGEIGGTLAIGRQEEITSPAGQAAKDFQDSVAQQKNAWSGAIGTGVGVGVSFIASPIGGAVAGGVAATVSSVVLEGLFQQSETDVLKDAGKDAGRLWEASVDSGTRSAQEAAINAAKAHNADYADAVADWALSASEDGFSHASTNARQMSDDLTTEIQP